MFQIVCALALDVPSVLQDIESLNGVSPNVCMCLSSDSKGAYVHGLSLVTEGVSPMEEMKNLSAAPGGDGVRMNLLPGAPGIGAICVSAARRLWSPAPGCLRAMEDGV